MENPRFGETIHGGGRRLAMRPSDTLDDWYVGWSPRNDSYCAEGTWFDWVELAQNILKAEEDRKAPKTAKRSQTRK